MKQLIADQLQKRRIEADLEAAARQSRELRRDQLR
jgi:hypothetical protein